jgi:hypothetical protein
MAEARRTLYRNTPAKVNSSEYIMFSGNSLVSQSVDGIGVFLKKLDSVVVEIKNVNTSLSSRIDKLEYELERKLTDKISQILDKRVTYKIKRINKSLDERLDTIRADFPSEIDTISGKINSVADSVQQIETVISTKSAGNISSGEDRTLNLVFRKMKETENENIIEKVNSLMKNQLRVDVTVASARRVVSQDNNTHFRFFYVQ